MPNITGCQLADMTKTCSALRLRIEIIQTKEDPELPDGTVVHQTPAPGHHVKERQTVFVAVTHKPADALTPSLIGASRETVINVCAQHNLKPKFYALSYPYPVDHCFCQWPSPEMPLKDKTLICYVAAQEENHALWPNFKGHGLQETSAALAEHGIAVRTNTTPKAGLRYYIVDQQPKAGARIDLNRTDEIIADFKIGAKRPSTAS